jgi:hypothetical protein
MKKTIIYLLLFILPMLIICSCIKKKDYPDVPYIEFESFTNLKNTQGIDTAGVLKISFEDGSGDIGLGEGDTNYPYEKAGDYYYNFIITYYEVQKGKLVKVPINNTFNGRIPPMTVTGINQPKKGTIEYRFDIVNPFSSYDTIVFDAYIYDRGLNKSNTIRTPQIFVKKQ